MLAMPGQSSPLTRLSPLQGARHFAKQSARYTCFKLFGRCLVSTTGESHHVAKLTWLNFNCNNSPLFPPVLCPSFPLSVLHQIRDSSLFLASRTDTCFHDPFLLPSLDSNFLLAVLRRPSFLAALSRTHLPKALRQPVRTRLRPWILYCKDELD